ncbi:hypothetical protein AVEN_222227-1 [Araneus ventricosus]|uniref:DUF4371 domain-containing protein n=1 Tax=Araneus ventricosus TaxID=182803 RepID=A0A4Y2J9T5_ARAVE|nr:hypothetical protein AVEN_222227-1 [Araneus ventricosus]
MWFFNCFERKYGICKHIAQQKHQDNAWILGTDKKDVVNKQNDHGVIQAESLFTAFIVEHNLQIARADHAGPLFLKIFPDSVTAKKYGCARTKTSAIVIEMGKTEKNVIISTLKKVPFSVATDGSNKGDFKLYPLVVTFHNAETQKIESSLLSTSALEVDSTGVDIAYLILNELKSTNIPLENCLAFSADNTPVTIGKKVGVAGILSNEIKHLVVHVT